MGGGKGPPLSYALLSAPERPETKRRSNYIYSEHPKHILAPCYWTAPTSPACNARTKGTFVLTVGDCPALNGDLGVLSAGPGAVSQGSTNGERKAIKGKYHDGIKGGGPLPPAADAIPAAFLWPPVRHAIQGVDKTYDLSPLAPLPPSPPSIEVRPLNRSSKQRHPAAYLGGLTDRAPGGFVPQGFGGVRGGGVGGGKLIDTSSSTSAYLAR
ncbi:hypothetical protein EYF80_034532 [Liparis tanakae]|uniref:Uncharacterized protein n=1 Tax=Liparis tanakae TaxID=230148 RepID=A0A4Z2GP80_9TELE|nr:hypothetical protein EYF80_034532 [Liparis tanakae]